MSNNYIDKASEHFKQLLEDQLARVERMEQGEEKTNFAEIDAINIGIIGGDGIGPFIAAETQRVLESLLSDQLSKGKISFRVIDDLTIEKRAEVNQAIPDDVLEKIKQCHVTLKGPTTTPRKGDLWPNIESANVAMRKELDLFANVRPVRVPKDGIDWVFFRENTEGAYALGSNGVDVTDDLALDFTVTTTQGSKRLLRLAFEYADKNNIDKLTLVTKANVVKTTDGKFLKIGYDMAKEYSDITVDDWYIDIMTAKLIDPKRRTQFRVMALPNLYGDILTDEAAEFQGGVGTAGSANIGNKYAMFEAIHGSAPRMVDEGRAQYADPSSMVRAGAMMLRHIGFPDKGKHLEMALDITGQFEKKLTMTGRDDGADGRDFCEYILDTMNDSDLEKKWESYQ